MSQFRCCEHSSYVLLFILSNERRTLCSMLVGGGEVGCDLESKHKTPYSPLYDHYGPIDSTL